MRDGETDTIYVNDSDRFIVSLIVGYTGAEVDGPADAAAAALDLTRDAGSDGTIWFVYDRETGEMHRYEQEEFQDLVVE